MIASVGAKQPVFSRAAEKSRPIALKALDVSRGINTFPQEPDSFLEKCLFSETYRITELHNPGVLDDRAQTWYLAASKTAKSERIT
jgi:hypothetical protein